MPKKTNLPIGFLCGLLLATTCLSAWPTSSAAVEQDQPLKQPITVHLSSGRVLTAEMAPETGPTQLWLGWRRGAAVLVRPIPWDRVVKAKVAGEEISGEQFRAIVEAVRREIPAPPDSRYGHGGPATTGVESVVESEPVAQTGWGERRGMPQVRTLAIDVLTANWDADVEVDGLTIRVCPLDVGGAVVPVNGSLEIRLTGQQTGAVGRRPSFGSLGRWTRQVRREDFGPQCAVYHLPFQNAHPEFDLTLPSHAAVCARLSVPGQGAFEATDSAVRIRPYSAIRDQWQQASGRRFFSGERTGRRPY
ncbi:MAG: hypothetical protein JXB62_21215 [Pirellulales bacterium]|nr:hypothetical protein [Pirellulales bacterium]